MKLSLKISAALLGILALAACQPDIPVGPAAKTPPEAYRQLVGARDEGKVYLTSRSISSATKVFFVDGTAVIAKTSEMEIHDCSEGEPLEVSYDHATGMWLLGGESTGISRVNCSDIDAFPVYAFYDLKYLRIYASNGALIEFDNGYGDKPAPPGGDEPENPGGDDPDNPGGDQPGGDDNPGGDEPDNPGGDQPDQPSVPYSIPTIYLTTDGGARIDSKENYVHGSIKVVDPSKKFAKEEVFEQGMQIRGRGNTTWGMPKRPYRIKLDGEQASILGMHKNRDWVLLANYSDKSLMRNIAALEMSRIVGMHWTPDIVSVEVYLNGEYQGVYNFTEHKEVAKHRVDIQVVTPSDNSGEALTGGYYLELEDNMDEPTCFRTERYNLPVNFHEPERPTNAQLNYIRNYFKEAETAIHNIQYEHDYTTWREYVDADSFVKYYIIEEICKDPDGNMRKSTFFTKERNKPLELYHVWDFDITLGNCDYTGFSDPTGWQMRYCTWYSKLFQDPEFTKAVKKMWKEVLPKMRGLTDYLNGQIDLLDGSQNRNFEKWDILGIYVWPNAVWLGSYEKEVAFLYEFIDRRIDWLDSEISKW